MSTENKVAESSANEFTMVHNRIEYTLKFSVVATFTAKKLEEIKAPSYSISSATEQEHEQKTTSTDKLVELFSEISTSYSLSFYEDYEFAEGYTNHMYRVVDKNNNPLKYLINIICEDRSNQIKTVFVLGNADTPEIMMDVTALTITAFNKLNYNEIKTLSGYQIFSQLFDESNFHSDGYYYEQDGFYYEANDSGFFMTYGSSLDKVLSSLG